MRSSIAVAAAVVIVGVVAGAVVVNRSSGSSSTAQLPRTQRGSVPGGGPPGFDATAMQKLTSCLQSHGVTLQQGARPDFGSSKVRAAMQACSRYAPQRPSGLPGTT